MRIGIPNITPLLGFIFFCTLSILFTSLFIEKFETVNTGANVLFGIFILLCYGMLGLLAYFFKIFIITNNELLIVRPFRFQFNKLKLASVENINWNIFDLHKFGDYRKLTISTISGYTTSISDFEFINYDSLEKALIDRTDVKLNLDRKKNVELQQAKLNRWLNTLVIIMLAIHFWTLSNSQLKTDLRIGIQVLIIVVLWRLVVRLMQYQKLINDNKRGK